MEEIITLSFHAPSSALRMCIERVPLLVSGDFRARNPSLWTGKMREKKNKAENRGFSPSYGGYP
jgi:hypothetical protein